MWLVSIFISCILFSFISCDNKDLCINEETVKKCETFSHLGQNDASIFIINAEGRLGNHLMAFAIILALAKSLHIR